MQNTELLLKKLTLEEKCALLSGAETFKTRGMPEHGIPQIWLSDGPHGLRKQAGESDHLGLNPSVPATCFPTASAVANSWDAALGEEIGAALGEEAAAQEVSVVLGPGLNMKRNPLCGRSFEYFSEDPYLAGKLAAGYIRGIQSKGVAACPKHFAVNSQETRRMASDSIVDERTLREIYLTGFEIAVKEGHPRSIMSSYNLVNGTYANENKHLLMEILRGEWGFDGAVITDWGGSNDHALGVKNGSTLEMPAPGGDSVRELLAAVESGKISESDIDARLSELLPLVFDTKAALDAAPREFDAAAHHALARRAAGQNRQQQAERFVRHAHALAQPHGHYNAGERADAHKARVAEAQLAGNADRQVEGNGHDDIRADRHELTLERAGHRAGGDHHLTGDERRDHNAEGYQGAAEFFASHGFHLTLSRARACPAGRSA